MGAIFDLNLKQWNEQARNVVAITGKKAGEVVRSEGKLLLQDVVRMTPPFSKGPSTESFNVQRKTGEAAVARDIRRVMLAVDDIKMLSLIRKKEIKDRLDKLIKKRDTQGVREILRKLGIPVASVIVEADPVIHERQRDRRGRIQRASGRAINVVLRGLTLKRYIREKQSHVGKAKAGWAEAAKGFGVKLPNWITRHKSPGQFKDNTHDPKMPSVTIGNLVDYIQGAGADLRIMERALGNRVRNMKVKIERILASGWKSK